MPRPKPQTDRARVELLLAKVDELRALCRAATHESPDTTDWIESDQVLNEVLGFETALGDVTSDYLVVASKIATEAEEAADAMISASHDRLAVGQMV